MPQPSQGEVARQVVVNMERRRREAEELAELEREHAANPTIESERRLKLARGTEDNEQARRRIDLRDESGEIRRAATAQLERSVLGARSARLAVNLDAQQRAARVREKIQEAAEWNRVLRDLPTPDEIVVRVKSEPLTYRKDNAREVSYFRDLLTVEAGGSQDASEARARLHRHELEVRVNPNTIDGQGGQFAPPQWLIEEFAGPARPGRVLSRLVESLPLAQGVSSVNLPRMVNGTATDQHTDGTATPSSDFADAACSSPAMTITGNAPVSLQLLEQSPKNASLDWAVFKDMDADYAARLEEFLLAGSGTAGQFWGVVSLDGTNEVVYADASPTPAEMVPAFSKAAGRIGRNRKQPPEAWLMTTARWAWLSAAGLPASTLTIGDPDGDGRAGTLLGWGVYPDDAIPETLGNGANEDLVAAVRPSDLRLWESAPRMLIDRESLSGTLQARLTLRRYVAFIPGRFPSGISIISGSGMVFPEDAK